MDAHVCKWDVLLLRIRICEIRHLDWHAVLFGERCQLLVMNLDIIQCVGFMEHQEQDCCRELITCIMYLSVTNYRWLEHAVATAEIEAHGKLHNSDHHITAIADHSIFTLMTGLGGSVFSLVIIFRVSFLHIITAQTRSCEGHQRFAFIWLEIHKICSSLSYKLRV